MVLKFDFFSPRRRRSSKFIGKNSVEEFQDLSKKANLLSEYFMERLVQASEITSLEKKALLASKRWSYFPPCKKVL